MSDDNSKGSSPKEEHPNYPVKDLQADEEYDKPQYNGVSNTHPKYSNGLKEAGGSRDDFTDEGLSLKAYLTYDAPDGNPIRKTPRGIGDDGPEEDPDVEHVRAEITSPLSGKVIIRHFEDGSTDRFICPKCAAYVAEKGDSHALDPIFYWGAGIFQMETQMALITRRRPSLGSTPPKDDTCFLFFLQNSRDQGRLFSGIRESR